MLSYGNGEQSDNLSYLLYLDIADKNVLPFTVCLLTHQACQIAVLFTEVPQEEWALSIIDKRSISNSMSTKLQACSGKVHLIGTLPKC